MPRTGRRIVGAVWQITADKDRGISRMAKPSTGGVMRVRHELFARCEWDGASRPRGAGVRDMTLDAPRIVRAIDGHRHLRDGTNVEVVRTEFSELGERVVDVQALNPSIHVEAVIRWMIHPFLLSPCMALTDDPLILKGAS